MKENIKKIIKSAIIAIIFSLILNIIFVKTNLYSNDFLLNRIFIVFCIAEFINLHFVVGFKKLYKYIIKYRYIIALIFLIFTVFLSYNGVSIHTLSEIIIEKEMSDTLLKNDIALSFWWNFRLVLLVLATYELCMIITNENKFYSIAGMIIISFSSRLQWNFEKSIIDIIIFGEIMVVLLNLFMKSNKTLAKLGISLAFSVCLTLYILTFDVGNIISLGYIFIALAIWIIIKNKKEYKFKWTDLIYIILPILITLLLNYIYYLISGKNIFSNIDEMERNKDGLSLLFSYIYSIFLPFKNIENAWYISSVLSVFPIPLIISFYYLYKNDKHTEFLFPLVVVATIEMIHCFSGLPSIISNILLFKYVSISSIAFSISLLNVYIYLYILANIKERIFNIKYAIRITLITVCCIIFVFKPTSISSTGYLYIYSCIYCMFAFLLLNAYENKYKNVFLVFAILITIISGGFVNPINKGQEEIIKFCTNDKLEDIYEEVFEE